MLQERRNESFWLHPKQLQKPDAHSLALPLTYLSPPHRMAFAWPYLFHLREGQQSQTVPLIHSNVSKLIFCSNGVLELFLEKSRLPLSLSCQWWLPQSGLSWTMAKRSWNQFISYWRSTIRMEVCLPITWCTGIWNSSKSLGGWWWTPDSHNITFVHGYMTNFYCW